MDGLRIETTRRISFNNPFFFTQRLLSSITRRSIPQFPRRFSRIFWLLSYSTLLPIQVFFVLFCTSTFVKDFSLLSQAPRTIMGSAFFRPFS